MSITKQFNMVDQEGYRRVNKLKAKRLFVLGYNIHIIPSDGGMNTHHKMINKNNIPDFDLYVQAYKDCLCYNRERPAFYINAYEVLTEGM